MTRDLKEVLESAIDANPDDLASWMAYADHLAEQGDPRGELMQVQLALEDETRLPAERSALRRREKNLLERGQREWLGDLAMPLLDEKPTQHQLDAGTVNSCRWARGGLDELCLWWFNLEVARALVRCPAARFLHKLEVHHNYAYEAGEEETEPSDNVPEQDEDFSALCVLYPAAFLPHLRTLHVGEPVNPEDERYDSGHCSARGLVGLLERTPRIEELHVLAKNAGLDQLFEMRLPYLKRLLVYHEAGAYPLQTLAKNPGMPALEELSLHPAFSEEGSYLPGEQVAALLRSPHFPALRKLLLRASDLGDKGCKQIVKSGILKRLTVLDLRHGCITDAGARTLAECPDVRNLELLNLADNQISEEGVALLGGLGINVGLESQHEVGSDEYLYSGDME